MSFMSFQPKDRIVPGVGPPDAKIAIIGEFTDNFDNNALRPFSGPGGSALESCLHAAGLIRGEVYLTNVIKSKPTVKPKGKGFGGSNWEYYDDKRCTFTDKGKLHVEFLRQELNSITPNVLVLAGPAAVSAVAGISRASKYRGYVMESRCLAECKKVIPTISPTATTRGGYLGRHLIVADLRKAKFESDTPEIIRPERQLVYSYHTVEEALEWLEYYENQSIVACDIEVINFAISCISFASSPSIACVIPIADRWTEEEELRIWRGIQRVLGNSASEKVFQNGIFDIQFMLMQNGLTVAGKIHDTMIEYSVMYPEFPKGLGFLGSLYCGAQAYWKDAVKFNNIKDES